MKKSIVFLIAVSFNLILFSQDYAVLRLGSTDASTLLIGDTVVVPVHCDDISNFLTMGWEIAFSFEESVLEVIPGFQYTNPLFPGNWFETYNYLPGGLMEFTANWNDPQFIGVQIGTNDIFFKLAFIYKGGETDLTWNYGSNLWGIDIQTILVDGCVCDQITFPAIFHIVDGDVAIEDAAVTINGEMYLTNELGMTLFVLQNDEYTYSVLASGYDEASGVFEFSGNPEVIYVDLEPEETYAFTFLCNSSCENDFNAWNLFINGNTMSSGETIFLTAGEWAYSLRWLDCELSDGNINVTGQMEFDCGFAGDIEPHVGFHVISSQGGDIENAEVGVDVYTIMTNASGEAYFCLPGGSFSYVVSKEGYDTITGSIAYIDYCQDATYEILMEPLKISNNTLFNYRIFPNPSNGKFNLLTPGIILGQIEVLIMDVTGRLVYKKVFNDISNALIDLSEQENGIYFVQIESRENRFMSKLVIK
jgi:hypothetical protein